MIPKGGLTDRIQHRRMAKLANSNTVECGLRLARGSMEGLSSRWRHGPARLTSGLIEFKGHSHGDADPPVLACVRGSRRC